MTTNTRLLKIAAAAFAILEITCTTLPSFATRYRPPQNIQRPEGRQGGATRSSCMTEQFTFEPILPTSNYGQTIAAYPTIYWYLKNHKFSWARIDLYPNQNPAAEAVPQYSKTLRLLENKNLHSFTFPNDEDLKALEVGQEYLWRVTLICAQDPNDDSADGSQVSIQGAMMRTVVPLSLQNKINRANPYDAYAEEGFWYDAIHDLAVQRHEQPQDLQLNRDWCDLIKETRLSAQFCP